ncbi:MAG: AbrB/MazE/SpoVT family DNA-binding domain-containing protein [Candidatus Gastranaerophilaceae bacterium]
MKIEVNRSLGVIRRVDDLGRIAIPKEIRHRLHIREGEALELNLCENGIYIEKHQPQSGKSLFTELLSKLADKKQEAILQDREQAEKISELEKFISENRKMFEEIN